MTTHSDAINRARVDELKDLDSTGAMLSAVIATFEETCADTLGQLDQQLRSGNISPARESAHSLAGRALMVGAQTAGESARGLEHHLVKGDIEAARAAWPDVSQAFAQARAALAEYGS